MKTDVPKDELNDVDGPEAMAAQAGAPSADPAADVNGGDAASLSDEQIQQLKAQAAKATEYWNQLLRTAADLDNYKKRAARENQEAIRFANESLLEKLIPVLDNFEMALAAVSAAPANTDQLQQGVAMIHQQLKQVLTDSGLQEINAAGQPFDPNCHEAISQLESSEVPDGHVLQQVRKGYKLRERLLRPATVVVAKAPAK